MSPQSKEYFEVLYKRYKEASRKEKTVIIAGGNDHNLGHGDGLFIFVYRPILSLCCPPLLYLFKLHGVYVFFSFSSSLFSTYLINA